MFSTHPAIQKNKNKSSETRHGRKNLPKTDSGLPISAEALIIALREQVHKVSFEEHMSNGRMLPAVHRGPWIQDQPRIGSSSQRFNGSTVCSPTCVAKTCLICLTNDARSDESKENDTLSGRVFGK